MMFTLNTTARRNIIDATPTEGEFRASERFVFGEGKYLISTCIVVSTAFKHDDVSLGRVDVFVRFVENFSVVGKIRSLKFVNV